MPAIPFTHVVIMFSKARHFITAAEHAVLVVKENGVHVTFGDTTINTSSIAEILPMEKYYELFPDERPVEVKDFIPPEREALPLDRQAERNEHSLRGVLAGMVFYQENHGSNTNLEAMLKPKLTRYQELYGKPFVMTEDDRERCVVSFSELDDKGLHKIPCHRCFESMEKDVKDIKKARSMISEDTISQFS